VDIEKIRDYCLKKQEVTEGFPFDDDTLVFKVCGKMFLAASLKENRISLKCDPELAVSLREHYDDVLPAWHFNKKFWNMIPLHSNIPDKLILEWIDHSYQQVIAKLPKQEKEKLMS
jgi:predicted DNA-binding protein (MmcQ/YjbR family)